MPPSKVADRATVSSNTASTTADFVLTGMTVGNLLIIRCAADNAGGGGAATSATVSNQSGTPINTSTDLLYTRNNDPGAASAGVTMHVVVAEITATSGTVRITFGASVIKAGCAEEWSGLAPIASVVVGTPVANDGVNSTNLASLAEASVADRNLVYGAIGIEGPNGDTFTQDADTTNGSWSTLTKVGTTVATADLNMTVVGGYKIVTATGAQTYNPTNSIARDSAGLILELAERVITGTMAGSLGFTGAASGTSASVAITQAAYGFYADGTETGSTAYSLTATLADSYAESNASVDYQIGITGNDTAMGESFLGNGLPLARASFYIRKVGSPVGNITAVLYAHTGTFGGTGTGTGSVLATSTTTISASTLTTTSQWVDFDFDGTFTPVNGTAYVIAASAVDLGNASNCIAVSLDNTSPTHAGRMQTRQNAGTWSASTADTIFRVYTNNYVADTSAGDVNLHVRVRLQATTAAAVPSTDDWQLQWEKNTSGTWDGVNVSPSLIDSYAETNHNANVSYSAANELYGQSFLGNGRPLSQLKMWAYNTGAVSGNVEARLYAHSGTFGSTSVGTGTPLATSTPRAVTSLGTTSAWETFTFDGTYTLANGTAYVIGIAPVTLLSGGSIAIGLDNSTPTHAGCEAYRSSGGTWTTVPGTDLIFQIDAPTASTAVAYASANLTDGAATTNRLGAGSGSFVAGKISETGLVTDLGWTANNYTELLYSVTIKQADVADGDTLRFRVLRNAATTTMTYTATPTISIELGAATVTGTAAASLAFTGTATGTSFHIVTGTAAGSLGFSGAATGTRITFGTGAGSLAFAGTATGTSFHIVTGTAAGSLGFAGALAGTVHTPTIVTGTASATLAFSAAATGTIPGLYTVIGQWGSQDIVEIQWGSQAVEGAWWGSEVWFPAVAANIVTGTGSGSLAFTGAATGTVISCHDVLLEPFDNFAAWTTAGTASIVAGRNGTAAQASGSSANRAVYTIPALDESDMITIGFAWRRTDAVTSQRNLVEFYSDSGATQHNRLAYAHATTTLLFQRGSTTLVQNAAITFTQNTWYYIEVQAKLGDSPNGTVIVRVDGTEVINSTGLDTKDAGTKTTYDTVRLSCSATSTTGQWDDLYLSTGAGCAFQGDITVPSVITGTAAASLSFTGTATGTSFHVITGTAAGSLSFTGAATGTVHIRPALVGTPSVFPAANTAATTLTIAIPTPAGATIGEGLIVALTSSAQTATDITLPSGWARIGLATQNDAGIRILGWFFHKLVATPASDYTFTSPAAGRFGGIMMRVQFVNATQPHKAAHAYGPRSGNDVTVYALETAASNQPTDDSLQLVACGTQMTVGNSTDHSSNTAGLTHVVTGAFGLTAGTRTGLNIFQRDISAGPTTLGVVSYAATPAQGTSNGLVLQI